MLSQNFLVAQVNAIIQLCKPQRYFHHFGPITIAQAFVLLPAKYSFDAFIYHLWANVINMVVQAWFEIWMLLGQNQN